MKIERKRGDTEADVFIVRKVRTGVPVNISGCTFVLTLDPEQFPADATNNLYAITGTILDAAAGTVEFAPSAGQADRVGAFFYDVQMTRSNGRKLTVAAGPYTYIQDIGKA